MAIGATSHPAKATAVLLSVRSVPNGQPDHHALKAYHCTAGPSRSPPRKRSPTVQEASFFRLGLELKNSNPARVEKSIALNMIMTCGMRIHIGTAPLNRIVTGSDAGTVSVNSPWSAGPGTA